MPEMAKTAGQLNRKYAIVAYLMYSFFFLLAMVECVMSGLAFHIPIFSFFIVAYMIGAYAAYKYKLPIERRVLYVCATIAGICLLANVYLLFRVDNAVVVRTMAIVSINIVWFSLRLRSINLLCEETRRMLAQQKGGYRGRSDHDGPDVDHRGRGACGDHPSHRRET